MAEKKNEGILQALKFFLFSTSAGLIQIGSFTLMNEVIIKLSFFQNLMAEHPGFAKIMENEYGPMYLIALILSVLWNFTFNRKFTFKSANNVPIAMLKVLGYYAVFTPVSTILGNHFTATGVNEYIVLGLTMLCNLITEFLFDKYVVFRDTLHKEET
ncbi:MAG: hypothetical protein KBS82_00055 [Oscillospiraceae bacterium]|nr:hypothetical protein [Candidatus Limimonas egerieequi]